MKSSAGTAQVQGGAAGGAAGTAAALAGAAAVVLALLARPIARFGTDLWGPEHPWLHRDFLGAFWLFWASGHPGDELALQSWPDGALPIQHHIPNPFDAWLLGPLVAGAPFPLWWNLLQLGHHLGNVLAATWLARAAGARPSSALAAGALVAACPLMLHEVAGGRTLSGVVWPGLLTLGLALRGADRARQGRPQVARWLGLAAGLLIGLQGLCYVYTGLLVGLLALILAPSWGLLAALVPMVPYVAWLLPAWTGQVAQPPPAGFTALPLAGLVGLAEVPERLRMHRALLLGLPALLVGLPALSRPAGGGQGGQSARLLAAILLTTLVALGPTPSWAPGTAVLPTPLTVLDALVPVLARQHHPVRAALVLAPLLALALSRLLDRLPLAAGRAACLAVLALALPLRHEVELAVPWGRPLEAPPGLEAARWLASHPGGAIVDLSGNGGAALGLQPIHGRAMLEGLRKETPRGDRRAGALRAGCDAWLRGERAPPGLVEELRQAGFTEVLVVDREAPVDTRGLEADLGAPEAPGLWAL